VNITAEITEVVERRVEFRVEAWDEKEKIGEGTHSAHHQRGQIRRADGGKANGG